MRIAIDGRKIESPLTGIGRYTKNLIAHVSKVDKDNEYVLIQNKDSDNKNAKEWNFKTIKVDYPAFSFRSMFFLHRILHLEKINLFHSPFVSLPLFAKCKTVLTVHDLIPWKFTRSYGKERKLFNLTRRLIFRLVLFIVTKKANCVITDSRTSQKTLEVMCRAMCKKTKVVYPAVENIFRNTSNEEHVKKTKKRFHLEEGKLILYIGTIRPHKNLVRLLEAFSILIFKRNQRCNLVIGGGKEEDHYFLRNVSKELNISKFVIFVANLVDNEIVDLMNAADVFVFPSLEEGFGLPPLEAMACGTPVVTSNAGSLPEIVGDAALLVDPYNVQELVNAVQCLLQDEELRNKFMKKGFERVKLFSWEKTAFDTLKVYESVIKEVRR